MTLYQSAMQQDPAQAEPHNLLGLAALQSGDHHVALELFRTAVALEETPEHLCNLGVGHYMLHSHQEAEDILRRVLDKAPGHLDALTSLGVILEEQGRLQEATELLDQACAVDPQNANILGKQAECRLRQGEIDQARIAAEYALELDPEEKTTLYVVVQVYQHMGRIESAIRHQEILQSLEPHVEEHGRMLRSLKETSSPRA